MQNARPSGSRIAAPTSSDNVSTSVTGVVPALTHLSAAGMYFSAFGWLSHSMARTDWSGRITHVSSVQRASSLVPAAVHVLATGS